MSRKLGVIMDPIESIKPYKDSSFAMMLAAQKKGWEIYYIQPKDLWLDQGRCFATSCQVTLQDTTENWYQKSQSTDHPLAELDVVLMRKDPPFNMDFVYLTYLLERAEAEGCKVINRPSSIRDCNEKLFTAWFPELTPPTLVTRNSNQVKAFLAQHQDIIVKPLDGMGGSGIFRIREDDPNKGAILETISHQDQELFMAQRYLPAITDGDKRILIINGKPVSHVLARIPAKGENRGNLAAGGRGVGQLLSDSDRAIAEKIGPTLVEKGLWFVGLDVIGDRVTEINVTSPTCIRELDHQFGLDIAGDFIQMLEDELFH
ncbi:glutathione synthase [Pelagibaculum spongiae]|uniref:Glutathione synthetase n=1 Tax=Pelagibaculum spongiae TaxID=2080658 RepID=A0A2V1H4P7_9GAMM|nr:glutathione synthase [Pelagibaculum spongiae]PVZ72167.1 glutathione synthase [Pelagibaculum spongiae]